MRLSDFDYRLPKELIAQHPLENRLDARLMVLDRGSGSIKHLVFKDVVDYLNVQDLLVLNDTKVLPARLKGSRKTGGKVEVLLLNKNPDQTFRALIKPARVKCAEEIIFASGKIRCRVISKTIVSFSSCDPSQIYGLGQMPLPPYIKREPTESDNIYYQTVYAREPGAIAAPTAGLHFTSALMEEIQRRGIKAAYVTLHVGYGTFKPVEVEDITTHKMEPEYFKINDEAVGAIRRTRNEGGRIVAVGTTSLRALESCARGQTQGYTDIFIYPGYEFKLTDCLLTNFHLPKTTLFLLVCAFAGKKLIMEAYRKAVEDKYRFYSYGDAMLII